MTQRTRVFGALLLAALCSAAVAAKLLTDQPLQWKPTSDLRLGTTQMSPASIQFETFKDLRDTPAAIGENREDDKPKPVTTRDDVGAFVTTHMRELFNKAGFSTVDSGGTVTIKGEIKDFFVRETNTYQAQVVVHLTVVGRDGTTLWSGLASGDATRFGRSYKLENYYETLSDALVNTVSSMLQSSEFQKALAKG
jgi:Uncharacterized lipoprotein